MWDKNALVRTKQFSVAVILILLSEPKCIVNKPFVGFFIDFKGTFLVILR